jgi:hypothetical protein
MDAVMLSDGAEQAPFAVAPQSTVTRFRVESGIRVPHGKFFSDLHIMDQGPFLIVLRTWPVA